MYNPRSPPRRPRNSSVPPDSSTLPTPATARRTETAPLAGSDGTAPNGPSATPRTGIGASVDWARDSVSLTGLRLRSRRNAAAKREKSKLGSITKPNNADEVSIATLESLYAPASLMHTSLSAALLNSPRTPRSSWCLSPVVSVAAYASARATCCESVARRCSARSQSNSPAAVAVREVARRLGAGAEIPRNTRDRLYANLPPNEVEWVVFAASLPALLATSSAAAKALIAPSSCPCCGERGIVVTPPSSTSSSAANSIRSVRSVGVPGGWPRVGRYLQRKLGHDFPVFKCVRQVRVGRAFASALTRVADDGGVSTRMKCLVGIVFGTVVRNERMAEEWAIMAESRGLKQPLFGAVKAFAWESALKSCELDAARSCLEDAMSRQQQSVLVWAKECAAVVGRPGGEMSAVVVRAVQKHLTPELMAEVAAFCALLAALHRVYLFFLPDGSNPNSVNL